MSNNFLTDNPLAAGVNEIRSYWGRFTALGILFMVSGLFCIFYSGIATAATVLVLGWMLLFSGIVSLIQSFWIRNWSGFFLFFLNALVQGVLGYRLAGFRRGRTRASAGYDRVFPRDRCRSEPPDRRNRFCGTWHTTAQ